MNVNWICVHRSHAIMVANAVKLAVLPSSASAPNNSMVNFVKLKSIAAAADRIARMAERALKHLIERRFANVRLVGSVNSVRFDRISAQISHARMVNALARPMVFSVYVRLV